VRIYKQIVLEAYGETPDFLDFMKAPTFPGPPRTLDTGLRQGPRGVHFLVSEVPL
jgi:hypothetical protein